MSNRQKGGSSERRKNIGKKREDPAGQKTGNVVLQASEFTFRRFGSYFILRILQNKNKITVDI